MRTAFKEWAVICRALARGRQDVILRKGGIDEPDGGFAVEHRDFLLLPTFLHQSPESIRPEDRDLLENIDADRPPEACVVFRHRAVVTDAFEVRSFDELARFRDRHVWSDAVVAERFHRWQERLHVLAVRVFPLPAAVELPWREAYAGCRSWVELEADVPVG
jgi:hypothetical protein